MFSLRVLTLPFSSEHKVRQIAVQRKRVSEHLDLYNSLILAIGKKTIAINLESFSHINEALHHLIDTYRRYDENRTAEINKNNESLRKQLATLALMIDDWEPIFEGDKLFKTKETPPNFDDMPNQKSREWNSF